MKRLLLCSLLASACTADPASSTRSFTFGPFHLEPGQEVTDRCISVTLHNDQPLYVNAVELQTAIGVHHANWFWVPEYSFPGPDGVWTCSDRAYSESAAGVLGSVLFAMSTQATHERQAFPPGVAIHVPPHAKLVAGLHLLDPSDEPLEVPLSIKLEPIAASEVTTELAGFVIQDEGLAIPPRQTSRFTVDCDLGPRHQEILGTPVDFSLYYVLPHYHALGVGLTVDALRDSDGAADPVWTTAGRTGDTLGGTLAPAFSMKDHARLRLSCTYDNPRDASVGWGVGDQEMCMALMFSDSPYTWQAGYFDGALPPSAGVTHDGLVEFTAPGCDTRAADATR